MKQQFSGRRGGSRTQNLCDTPCVYCKTKSIKKYKRVYKLAKQIFSITKNVFINYLRELWKKIFFEDLHWAQHPVSGFSVFFHEYCEEKNATSIFCLFFLEPILLYLPQLSILNSKCFWEMQKNARLCMLMQIYNLSPNNIEHPSVGLFVYN